MGITLHKGDVPLCAIELLGIGLPDKSALTKPTFLVFGTFETAVNAHVTKIGGGKRSEIAFNQLKFCFCFVSWEGGGGDEAG